MCVSLFCTALCEAFPSPVNVQRDTGREHTSLHVTSPRKRKYLDNYPYISPVSNFVGAYGSVVVEALRYKPEGRGFETR
jgi:hypothetical protein